jgi:hypothetical protein
MSLALAGALTSGYADPKLTPVRVAGRPLVSPSCTAARNDCTGAR